MKDFINRIKKHEGERLISIVCTDTPNNFDLDYYFDKTGEVSIEKVRLPKKRAIIDSVIEIFPVASFYEKEIFEGFRVKFKGHDLKKLFTSEELREKNPMRRYKNA
jgi:NADH:ubiquinone oxidoreductase subunit C